MFHKKRFVIPMLLILSALSVSAYILKDNSGKRQRNPASELIRSAPDISLEGISQTFVEKGKKKWTLKAASARLSRAAKQTLLDDIDVGFFTANGKSFRVTADKGLLSLDTNDAEVFGNVIIHNPDYEIHTQSLRYKAESHIITTDEPVRIESDSLHLTGDGLRYDLVSMKAELTGNVKGIISGNLGRL